MKENVAIPRLTTQSKEAYCLMMYEADDGLVEWLWNSRDGVTPFCIDLDKNLQHVHWQLDAFAPFFVPPIGMRVFVDMTMDRAREIARKRLKAMEGGPYAYDAERDGPEADLLEGIAQDIFRPGEPDIAVVDIEMRRAFAKRAARSTWPRGDSMRVRKAWEIIVKGLQHDRAIYFAPTASKARYQGWLSARESYDTIKLTDIRVIRAADRDVQLPEPEPILAELTDDQRHCLLHSFGASLGDPYKAGYRDYFYTRPDDPPLVALVERGLMTGPHMVEESRSGGKPYGYFYLSDAGKRAALSAMPTYAS